MKAVNILAAGLAALAVGASASFSAHAAEPPVVDLRTWTPPDIASVKDDDLGKMVKYGHALATETQKYLGPEAADPAKRYSGNNLRCQSCHINAGTQAYAMPWIGVHAAFPMYRARENGVATLEERIQGCMERSMNGKALPVDGPEMTAFLSYMKWLSSGIPVGAKIEGAGIRAIKEPARAANPERGRQVFAGVCAACHQADGQGVRHGKAGDGAGYQFPPLWGPDSYNDGAGMYRGLTAAAFVHANMPLGTTYAAPSLSDDDALDVVAFINSQPRPHRDGLDKDYPDRLRKPVDMPFPPFADGFPAEQHKYGPFEPIRAKLKALATKAP